MKRYLQALFFAVVVGVLYVYVKAQAATPETGQTFGELYQTRLGITLTADQEHLLNLHYPVGSWHRELVFQFDDSLLRSLLTWQYNFQASSPAELNFRRAIVDEYLTFIGMRDLVVTRTTDREPLVGAVEALETGALVQVEQNCISLFDSEQPIRVRPETAELVRELTDHLEVNNLCGMVWTTSSFRPAAQTALLEAFGFAASPASWGINPAALGRSVTIALSGNTRQGAYSWFLNSISVDDIEIIRQQVYEGEFPTIENMLSWGVTFDQWFMDLWTLLNQYFTVGDLTGFQSIEVTTEGISFWRVNPVFTLIDIR